MNTKIIYRTSLFLATLSILFVTHSQPAFAVKRCCNDGTSYKFFDTECNAQGSSWTQYDDSLCAPPPAPAASTPTVPAAAAPAASNPAPAPAPAPATQQQQAPTPVTGTIGTALIGDDTPTKKFFDEWGTSATQSIGIIVARIINVVMGFLGIVTVALITYAGFLWLTAAGEEDKVKTATKILSQSVIGLLIAMSAWSVSYFVIISLANTIR